MERLLEGEQKRIKDWFFGGNFEFSIKYFLKLVKIGVY